MNNFFQLIFFSTIFILLSCNEKVSDAEIVLNDYKMEVDSLFINLSEPVTKIKFNQWYDLKFYTYINNKLSMISGTLSNRNYGSEFYFHKNGKLEKYQFVKGDYNSYKIDIDKSTGLLFEQGNPMVDYLFTPAKRDSNYLCQLLFTTYPRKVISVKYAVFNQPFNPLTLNKSRNIPLAKEAELYCKLGDTIIIRIEAKELQIRQSRLIDSLVMFDTIFSRKS